MQRLELTDYTVFTHQYCIQRFRCSSRMMKQKSTALPLEIFRLSNFFSGGVVLPDIEIHGVSLRSTPCLARKAPLGQNE